ncbi:4'-phosphopantetheinyl transferase superfamily protein [Micrococcus lylae]|uniref:4'-phosphopantetheinyl transferase superfamily protein n=1 Tax=Micrococcus lylae TaxID=1273 RepID=UPI0021A8A28F|nr:4'-phosphopantetheinyl transferase superfamily protein [Micrococcus lylae]MCT2007732.1 4'-phosphopantetheinyl transferase superfamily protein [Micrococcus lylae]MCT2071485.1 4'-phosphopantetheinyl transferase superfamily protein [Micrococcus lylae]
MTTAPTAPGHGVLVGAVGVCRAERTALLLARLEALLGLAAGSLRIERTCPACGARDHGEPALAWAAESRNHDDGPHPGGRLARVWGRLRGSRQDVPPTLPAVSLSHTAGERPLTVLAWRAAGQGAVGVDVEDLDSPRTRRALEPGPDGRAASDAVAFSAEQLAVWDGLPRHRAYAARVDAWCRAEALVKARGTGFATADPSAVQPTPAERVLPLTAVQVPGLPEAVRGVLVLAPSVR